MCFPLMDGRVKHMVEALSEVPVTRILPAVGSDGAPITPGSTRKRFYGHGISSGNMGAYVPGGGIEQAQQQDNRLPLQPAIQLARRLAGFMPSQDMTTCLYRPGDEHAASRQSAVARDFASRLEFAAEEAGVDIAPALLPRVALHVAQHEVGMDSRSTFQTIRQQLLGEVEQEEHLDQSSPQNDNEWESMSPFRLWVGHLRARVAHMLAPDEWTRESDYGSWFASPPAKLLSKTESGYKIILWIKHAKESIQNVFERF